MPSSISSITSGDSELAVPIFSSGKFEDDELDAACFAELSISLQVKEPAAGTPPPQPVLRQGSHTEAMRHDPGQELAIFQQRAQQASQEEQERADAAVAAFMFGVSEQADRQAGSLQPPEAASSSTAHGNVVAPDDILAQMDTPSRKQAARGQGCVHQSNASIVDWPGNPEVGPQQLAEVEQHFDAETAAGDQGPPAQRQGSGSQVQLERVLWGVDVDDLLQRLATGKSDYDPSQHISGLPPADSLFTDSEDEEEQPALPACSPSASRLISTCEPNGRRSGMAGSRQRLQTGSSVRGSKAQRHLAGLGSLKPAQKDRRLKSPAKLQPLEHRPALVQMQPVMDAAGQLSPPPFRKMPGLRRFEQHAGSSSSDEEQDAEFWAAVRLRHKLQK